jgi:multiple sugar transport system ATP-binding protein
MGSLAIQGARKSLGRTPALNGIDLSLQDGDFCVLIGPPGAGKTTLLRVIAGLERTDGGTIEMDGEIVDHWAPRDRNVAMVFKEDAVFPRLSIYKNIAFGLRTRRLPRAEIESRVQRFAELAGIAEVLNAKAASVSSELRQRAAIGRAFVRDDALCLIDDPFAALDAQPREAARAQIKRLHAEFPSTKIFATRDPIEATMLGDRVVLMRAGRIEQEGAPLALFEKPATRFVAGFFGSPPMNFLPGTLERAESVDVIRLSGDGFAIPLPPHRVQKEAANGLSVIVGLRPEHMMRAVRASPGDGSLRHEAEIELLQPVGARTYATFRIGGVPVVAELHAHDASRPGDRVPIDLNLKRLALFDATTERAL